MSAPIGSGRYRVQGAWFRAGKRLWSKADEATLRRRFPHMRTDVLARQLRRRLYFDQCPHDAPKCTSEAECLREIALYRKLG